MLENFNEDKRKNSMAQFSDFHTGWSIFASKGQGAEILFRFLFLIHFFER